MTFRGTCNLKETFLDLEIFVKSYILRKPKINNLEIEVNEIYEKLSQWISVLKSIHHLDNIIFSGHSLGSILCCLVVMRCINDNLKCLYKVLPDGTKIDNYFMFLLGNPSTEDSDYVNKVDKLIGNNYLNICNNDDLVMKGSSLFINNLNNVIRYQTINSIGNPFMGKLWTQSVNMELGDNQLTKFTQFQTADFLSKLSAPLLIPLEFFPLLIHHSIVKYVDIIYLYLSNYIDNEIEVESNQLLYKFNNIFQNIHNILQLSNRYLPNILFIKGDKKSIKKQQKKNTKKKHKTSRRKK